MKPETAASHRQRIVQALTFIERHLDEPLSVAEVARRHGFALHHFQRVFRQQIGESPHRYLQRLRLERAAFRLKRAEEPITQLALGSGYQTHEAFTRAFRAEFGQCPSSYRRRDEWADGCPCAAAEIVTEPARKIAFVRHVGPYAEAPRAFSRLRAWAAPRGLLAGATLIGVPRDHKRITAPELLRYDIGIVIEASIAETREVGVQQLDGGRYVRAEHRGSYDELDAVYDYLHARWIPEHGLRSGNRPSFEIYVDALDATAPSPLRTHVYVPLAVC